MAAIVAAQTKKAKEAMPISLVHLGKLFDYLDVELANGCDHTQKLTIAFLISHKLNVEKISPWLKEQGGYCDCEILANVEENWESEINKNR